MDIDKSEMDKADAERLLCLIRQLPCSVPVSLPLSKESKGLRKGDNSKESKT